MYQTTDAYPTYGSVTAKAVTALEAAEEGALHQILGGVMIQAGRGLAAAHAAGVTHRDFKPANVMVGHDGRVRVLDFGLARPEGSAAAGTLEASSLDDPTHQSPEAHGDACPRRDIAVLTERGKVVGTPAYMSPEQLRAAPLDARSDQFSFCVVLHEALHGERPFHGGSPLAQLVAIELRAKRPAPDRTSVPRWLQAVVERGLALEPADRFADMEALLRELERPRGRMRRIGLAAGGLVLGGVAVGAALWRAEPPCTRADAELATQWDDATRARTREAFAAAGPSYGAEVAERVITELDARVEAWRAEQQDACEDTRVRQIHTERILERRMACIERNTALVRALLDELPRADDALAERAMDMVEALPAPSRCQDLDALGPEAHEDPEAVQAVREALARVKVTRLTGHEAEARAAIEDPLAAAEATGYAPLHAEALVEAARVRQTSGQPADARQAMQMVWQALDLADLHGHDALSFESWLELLSLDPDHDRARLWARRAEVALARTPGAAGSSALELASRRGVRELEAHDFAASERWIRQGLADAEAMDGVELARAHLLEALANTLRWRGRGVEAKEAFAQAEALWRARLGPSHPYLARNALNFGLLLTEQGELTAARERLTQAHARFTELHGPQAHMVGRVELALANLDQATGSLDDALAHATRGRKILHASVGPEHDAAIESLQTCAHTGSSMRNVVPSPSMVRTPILPWCPLSMMS